MSFDINWETVINDKFLDKLISDKLNKFVQELPKPNYLDDLKILNCSLGTKPPNLILKSITTPHHSIVENPNDNDLQFLLELKYDGDLTIDLQISLVLNYLGNKFIKLPIKMTISMLQLHCLCVLVYLVQEKQIIFSVICDIDNEKGDSDDGADNETTSLNSNSTTVHDHSIRVNNQLNWSSFQSLERVAIIRHLKIDTEIGNNDSLNGSVLRNVDNLEQFLLNKLKEFIRDEIGWPNWVVVDYSTDEETAEEEDEEAES